MIELKELETFRRVAQLKSFRLAAERLNTTQPSVSQRIAQLEQKLGITALHRSTRKVTLTAAGEVLLEHAERMLMQREELLAALVAPEQRAARLRLGVSETIVHTWLPRLIERATERFPRLELEVEVDISPNLRDRLIGHEIDLAFMLPPGGTPAIQSQPLCRYDVAFLASPHLGLPRSRLGLSRLLALPFITFARNTKPHADLLDLLASVPGPRAKVHCSASVATIARMALDGLGVAVLPPAVVAREIEAGALVVVKTRERLPALDFVAAWGSLSDRSITRDVARLACAMAAAPCRAAK